MLGDALLDLGHARERAVPARLQLARHEAVLGIGGVVLAEGPIGGVARRLEVARQGLARLVAPRGRLRLGRQRRLHRGWLHDGEQRRLDGVIDAQAAEGDAVRLAVVEPPADAGVARDLCPWPRCTGR